MKSWKTTVAGIAAMVASLAGALAAEFDSDPATMAEWSAVIAAFIAGVGLLFAKDNKAAEQT